ncbi:autoinducer binding domain-containing protein [Ancylobacter oerskovii]|nr:autoinducer binding domain-containing protein [Ancylobacter oerskovii]
MERSSGLIDVEDCLVDVARDFGLTCVFGGLVPSAPMAPANVRERTLFQRLPAGWAERYNGRGYLFRDPIFHRLQHERVPFSWEDAYGSCERTDDVSLIRGEASEFGLRAGYVVPIALLGNGLAAISFGGDRASLDPAATSALGFLASYAIGRALQHTFVRKRSLGSLTVREYECLQWASEGKTDWEIAIILGISRPTVTKHLQAIREKLGAVTKGHAIAIALRNKILR